MGTLCSQTVHRDAGSVGNDPVPGLNVDGDVLSEVINFDLGQDVPLAYLLAQANRFFAGAAWGHSGFALPSGRRSLRVPHTSCLSKPLLHKVYSTGLRISEDATSMLR